MFSADLIRDRRFWKVAVAADNAAVVSFGAIGSNGRSMSKSFPCVSEAEEWARAAAYAKELDGYAPAAPEAQMQRTTRAAAKKRRNEEEAASLSAAKKLRRSARNRGPTKAFSVKEEESLGEIDPHVNAKGSIVKLEGEVCDVMLAEVDPAKKIDNFVILQLIRTDNEKAPFVVFKRSGFTGTVGQIWRDSYKDLSKAVTVFTDLFKEIAGFEWGPPSEEAPLPLIPPPAVPSAHRFLFITQDYVAKRAFANGSFGLWQYWVDDGIDGKATGWYPYTESGNHLAEALYLEAQLNPGYHKRVVRSGAFSYLVDLALMTQTNVTHSSHTVRVIRRLAPGETPNSNPPLIYPTGDPIFPEPMSEDDDHIDDEEIEHDEEPPTLQGVSVPLKSKKPNVKRESVKPGHTVVSPAPAGVLAPVAPKKGAKTKKTSTKTKNGAKKASKKKAKIDPTAEPETDITPAAVEEPATPTVKPPVDAQFPDAHKAEVVDNYDATLNQTNITDGRNNNKYYRLQLLCVTNKTDQYVVWTRWGRVGETHAHSTKSLGPFKSLEKAISEFEKKFYSKTANKWENRTNFVPHNRKYDLLEVDYTKKDDAHLDAFAALDAAKADAENTVLPENVEYLPSKLDAKTQDLVNMLFEKDLYADAMREFDIDTRRMPLGQLTAAQIQRGIDVLEEISSKLSTGGTRGTELEDLSSRFYSVIPHDFGRQRPPIINNAAMVQSAFDKCNVLMDITQATKLMADAEVHNEEDKKAKKEKVLLPNPIDAQYDSLNAGLSLVTPGLSEHKKVLRAFDDTSCQYSGTKVVDVWRVDRNGEDVRFSKFSKLANHKLLWHGTNIAVVAAILSTGLRIMPHSGGRCGSGIYLASESGKSQGYTRPNSKRKIGCMFLAEAALGREFSLLQDDSSLKKAPQQFDSVVARGSQTPGAFEQVAFDTGKVLLPSEKPVQVPAHSSSSFWQDEYLVYREEQVRLRYVLTVRFPHAY